MVRAFQVQPELKDEPYRVRIKGRNLYTYDDLSQLRVSSGDTRGLWCPIKDGKYKVGKRMCDNCSFHLYRWVKSDSKLHPGARQQEWCMKYDSPLHLPLDTSWV